MGNIYRSGRPTEQLLKVRTDDRNMEYEFWLLVPIQIGGARRVNLGGARAIVADDGSEHRNLDEAAEHYRHRYEASKLSGGTRPPRVRGVDIVRKGKWEAFCKLKGLDVEDLDAAKGEFVLSNDELEKLGLAQ
jgi:acyl-CoA-binding protein